MEIVKEKLIMNDPDTARERHFANDYLDESPKSARAMSIRGRIIDGSRRCLEKQYEQILFSSIEHSPD